MRASRTVPATAAQARLWVASELDPTDVAYNVGHVWIIDRTVRLDALEHAVRRLEARHESLRLTFAWDGASNELIQDIGSAPPAPIERLDLENLEEVSCHLAAETRRPFNLTAGPLHRWYLAALGERSAIGLVAHHAICDSVTLAILASQLLRIVEDRSWQPPVATQPREIAERERSDAGAERRRRDLAYWREALSPLPPDLFSTQRGGRSWIGDHHHVEVDGAATAAAARLLGVTEATVLFTAVVACLHRFTTNERILVGMPVAGRQGHKDETCVGYLSNTVPVLLEVTSDDSFRDLAQHVAGRVFDSLEHGSLPFGQILRTASVPSGADPYQVVFAVQDLSGASAPQSFAGLTVEDFSVANGSAKSPLTVMPTAIDDKRTTLFVEYDKSVLDASWVEAWSQAVVRALEHACRDPDESIGGLLLAQAERPEDRSDATAWHGETVVTALFDSFRQHSTRTAIESEGRTTTYAELERRVWGASSHLRDVAGQQPVGLRLGRGVDQIVYVVACLVTGVPFVPIDPRYPEDRIEQICAIADVGVVLDDAQLAAPERRAARPRPAHLAYVYFTSGSSGTPKGVPIDHRCLSIRMQHMLDRYPLGPGDFVLNKTPLIFDIAIWEMLLPLIRGGTVVVAPPGREADPQWLATTLPKITLAHFVPSMLRNYLDETEAAEYPALRWVIASGEACPDALMAEATSHFSADVHTQYGQSETSEVTQLEGPWNLGSATTRLGLEVGAYSVSVVDARGYVVPVYAVGEIAVSCFGGLAWGYLSDPVETARKFVPHPNPSRRGQRLYRTGDLGRRLPDGCLEFLGRVDRQVKLRGCRVELEEIEQFFLSDVEGVSEVAAVVREREGHEELATFVVVDSNRFEADRALRLARRRLPWFLVPSSIHQVGCLPRTGSGKVDTNALCTGSFDDLREVERQERPRRGLEQRVHHIWKSVLPDAPSDRNYDFMRAGGSSLRAIQVVARVSDLYDIDVTLRQFWADPTVAGLSAEIHRQLSERVLAMDDNRVDELLYLLDGESDE